MTITKMTARELKFLAAKIDQMRKLERQVHRINELDCNEVINKRQSDRRERLESEYAALASEFGLFVETQRDPRGYALKLHDTRESIDSGEGVGL